MRTIRKTKGLKVLSRTGTGGLVFCENCEKILGSINIKGYSYINMQFLCTCGNYGFIEVARKAFVDISNPVNKMPSVRRQNLSCCRKCETPLFSVIEDRIRNYSFYIECKCGERYDTKGTFDKRLGETLKILKKSREKA